jgi:DNA-binding response OmpR family regulator
VATGWSDREKTMTIPTQARVLVVEDEPNIRELVCLHLGLEGYICDGVGEGRSALPRLQA